MHAAPSSEQLGVPRQCLQHRSPQARTIQSASPNERWPTVQRSKKEFRFAAIRKHMDVRRAMVVENDDKPQVSGAMNSRHAEHNPSDGLFNDPSMPS